MALRFTMGGNNKDEGVGKQVVNFDQFADFIRDRRQTVDFDGTETEQMYNQKKSQLAWVASYMKGGRLAENVISRPFFWFDIDGCDNYAWQLLHGIMNDFVEGIGWTTPGHNHPLKSTGMPNRLRIVLASTRELKVHEIEPAHKALEAHIRKEMAERDTAGLGFSINFDRSVYTPTQIMYLPHQTGELFRWHGEPIDPYDYLTGEVEVDDFFEFVDRSETEHEISSRGNDILDECERVMFDPAFLKLGVERGDWLRQVARLAAFKDTEYEQRAFLIACRWSQLACPEKYNEADLTYRWKGLGNRTTPFAIFKEARSLGIDATKRFEEDDDSELFEEVVTEEPAEVIQCDTFVAPVFSAPASAKYIVQGLIPQGVTLLVGATASFKSYAALSIACCVAINRKWADRHINSGNVVYVAGEGYVGIPQRVDAWRREMVNGAPLPNLHLHHGVNLQDKKQALAFVKTLDRYHAVNPLQLVVLDTFSSMFRGESEQDNAGIAAFLRAADAIARRYSAAVVVVHHPAKGATRARGGTAFESNADAVLFIERDGDGVVLSNSKQKYGSCAEKQCFGVPARQLPDDYIDLLQKTQTFTTCTETDYPDRHTYTERVFIDLPTVPEPEPEKPRKLTRIEDDAAQILIILEGAQQGAHVEKTEWRRLWLAAHNLDKNGGTRRRFDNAVDYCIESAQVIENNGFYELVLSN